MARLNRGKAGPIYPQKRQIRALTGRQIIVSEGRGRRGYPISRSGNPSGAGDGRRRWGRGREVSVAREDVRLSRQSSEDAYDLRQLERRERCRRRYLRTANELYVAASVDQRTSKIKLREIELAPIRGEIGAVQHIASGSLKDIPRFPGQVEQHMGGRHSRQCHWLVCLYPTRDVDDEDIAGGAAERQPGILDVGHVDDVQTAVTVDYLSVVDVAERLGGGQRGSVVGNILRGSERSGSNARRDRQRL